MADVVPFQYKIKRLYDGHYYVRYKLGHQLFWRNLYNDVGYNDWFNWDTEDHFDSEAEAAQSFIKSYGKYIKRKEKERTITAFNKGVQVHSVSAEELTKLLTIDVLKE